MAKYYIQSGISKTIVTACDAEGAALWFLDRVINAHLPANFNTNEQAMTESQICLIVSALDQLDPSVFVSEIGFGRKEAGEFDTEFLFKQWCTLINAMKALLDQLSE